MSILEPCKSARARNLAEAVWKMQAEGKQKVLVSVWKLEEALRKRNAEAKISIGPVSIKSLTLPII